MSNPNDEIVKQIKDFKFSKWTFPFGIDPAKPGSDQTVIHIPRYNTYSEKINAIDVRAEVINDEETVKELEEFTPPKES